MIDRFPDLEVWGVDAECLAYWGILYSERWTSPILGIVNPGKRELVGRI